MHPRGASPNHSEGSSHSPVGTGDVDWTSSLAARLGPLSATKKNGTLKLKKTSTYSGMTASLKLRGTVLDLSKSVFTDFPLMKFKEFPSCNLELSKEQAKTYKRTREGIVREREILVTEREALLASHREQDALLTKAFQSEVNNRGNARLKDFQKRQQIAVRERKQANDPIPEEQLRRETESFESQLASELEQYQAEHERRLLENRYRWVMPCFQMLRATEFMHYARLHQLEFYFLEETQAEDRRQMEENHVLMNKLDVKGFDKELKGTIRNRKKQLKPMEQEEIDWQKEVFQQAQNDRFDELARRLDEDHMQMREVLATAQQKQLVELTQYYADLEAAIRSDQPPASKSSRMGSRRGLQSAV